MPRLASPIADVKPRYDVVIVGSGYGGAIAASRLARATQASGAPLSVCVLERGREFQPGEYPDTPGKVLGEVQLQIPGLRFFSRTGLYDFRFNDDINVFVGCGLGGTSLINANVCLDPEDAVFSAPWWPQGLLADMKGLRRGFERAREMLDPSPLQAGLRPTPPAMEVLARSVERLGADSVGLRHTPRKLEVLEQSGARLGMEPTRPPIAVTFAEGVNRFGVLQHACEGCGDCVSGCNYGSKNTLIMNYLPDAKAHGAEMYTEVAVQRVEPVDDGWAVHYELLDAGREHFTPPPMVVTARFVILAAGTLGSTEILLRSARFGLTLSSRLGERFSSNGDVVAVSYNGEEPVEAVGFGRHRPEGREPVGPTITGSIDLRRQDRLNDGIVIQEGAIPGAIAVFIPPLLAFTNVVAGRWVSAGRQSLRLQLRRWLRCLHGAYRGAVRSTQTFLVMTHDRAAGVMRLDPRDRLRVEWPGVSDQPLFDAVGERLREASEPLKGAYIRSPYKPTTVHPLGGCVMAEDAEQGVVDHEGRVFRGRAGTEVHHGLYVSDGSIIPRSLGINPLLTISALAERMSARLAAREKLSIDYGLPAEPSAESGRPEGIRFSERLRPGLGFSERMTGWIGNAADPPDFGAAGEAETEDVARFKTACQRAADQGEQDGSPVEAVFTVISDDLERMLAEPSHEARLVGVVVAPTLSARPMTVRDGHFHFLRVDPDRVETRHMVYRMRLISDTGRSYFAWGIKEARNALPWKCWGDLTTLHLVIVAEAPDQRDGSPCRLGVLRISGGDVLRQLSTIRARNVRRFVERIDGPVRFVSAFLAHARNLYGRLLADSIIATPDVPPPRWPARRAPDQVIPVETPDGFLIHLSRYRRDGGRPIILAPGLGVAGSSYAAETVETNLVEYLAARGYDVWLLDYRASPVFPPPAKSFTIDDIALRDWPSAVDEVLRRTGAEKAQILAHCVSALALLMSLLGGCLKGKVRSVICSQVGAHPIVAPQNEVKVGIYLASVLRFLRYRQITASFNARAWGSWTLDQLLKLYPTRERCNSPVCRRILFIFHESFHHAQLNTETHDAMWRWYGAANLTAMKHLSLMIREGHLVDDEGRDSYMPHVETRLTLPISFMHGSLNRAFLPRSTQVTFEWLMRRGRGRYQRQEFPRYGHMDCFVGRRAAQDVFPWIAEQLNSVWSS